MEAEIETKSTEQLTSEAAEWAEKGEAAHKTGDENERWRCVAEAKKCMQDVADILKGKDIRHENE